MQPYTTEQLPMPMALRPNEEKKMAKQKGARANKPNDSFGTVNNTSLYRNKYRDDVYKEDEEDNKENIEQAVSDDNADPSNKEATQDKELSESFAQKKETKDVDYKKRYDDLKRHYDQKQEEWKQKVESVQQPQDNLNAFKDKYPDVHNAVEEIATNKAEAQLASLKQELDALKGREKELEKEKAYEELLRLQPDFNTLKEDEKFLKWLDTQPESISDGILKNNSNAKWASRIVDLYYADNGSKKSVKVPDAAISVSSKGAKEVSTSQQNKKVWKASEIGKMKPWDFEKLEKEIDKARSEGS